MTLVLAAFPVLFAHSVFGQSSSLVLSSGTAASDGTVALNLNLSSPAGMQPAALQWKFTFAAANIVSISANAGAAATSAGKSLKCVSASGSYSCVASGPNANIIANGVVAVVNVKISAGVSTTAIGLTNSLASSSVGDSMTVTQTGGTITGYVPTPVPALSALSCTPTTVFSGGTSNCTVTLSGAAATGGTSVALSDNSSLLTVPASVTVSAGNTSATFNATAGTVTAAQTAVITASANGVSKTVSLSLASAPSGSYSIWSSSATPATITDSDTQATEVGMKFRSSVNGYVTGVRFYKGPQNTGTHVGHLWSRTGTLLATATFSGETASGWQQASFPSPVAINAGTTYVISYLAPVGRYSGDIGYFTSSSVTNGPLTALREGDDGSNGVYRYGQNIFPNATWQSSNYWVDVVFQAGTPSATVTVSSLTCTPATLASAGTSTCTVTLSGAAPSGGAAVALSDNSSMLTVPASVSVAASTTSATFTATAGTVTANTTAVVTAALNGGSKTASLSLTAAAAVTVSSLTCTPTTLASGASSTCTVKLSGPAPSGGASVAVSDNSSMLTVPASANVAASATSATFTATAGTVTANATAVVTAGLNGGSKTASLSLTAPSSSTSYSIWSSSATPKTVTDPDTTSVELGLKFRSNVAGQVTGVRFYKGSQNTGTHVGHLWSKTGTLLATVTFTGETASGWQQANFSSPVAIQANTTYVVSYLAPVGRYSTDEGYFTSSSVTNGPLTALRNGTDGSNGVYRYGTGGFPTSTWNSSNYWVDVVFQSTSGSSASSTLSTVKTTSEEKTALASDLSSLTCSPKVVHPGDSFNCELQLSDASGSVDISVDGSDKVILPSTVAGRSGQRRISFQGSVNERAIPQPITITASRNGERVEDSITALPASAPVIVVPSDQLIRSGDTVAFKVSANSSAPVALSSETLPKGASFDVGSGQFQWTPGPDQLGEYSLKFKATSEGSSSTAAVQLVVDDGKAVIRNAADLVCAPGSRATLIGKWLGPDETVTDLTGSSLELGGTTVSVNGSLVPVLIAGKRQVSFLCPDGQPGDTVNVALKTPTSSAAVVNTTMRAANPTLLGEDDSTQGAIFAAGSDKLAVVRNATLAGQPAQPGDVVTLRATGLQDGIPVSVKIGDVFATAVSVSRVADQAGVWAIQATVPTAPQFGSAVPVRIEVASPDGRQLQSNTVTMAIEPQLP